MIIKRLKTNQVELKRYICEACGFSYWKPEWAKECEKWNAEHGWDNHLGFGHKMGGWVDDRGLWANPVEKTGMICVSCKKEFAIGDVRYPIYFSGNFNRCRTCSLNHHKRIKAKSKNNQKCGKITMEVYGEILKKEKKKLKNSNKKAYQTTR